MTPIFPDPGFAKRWAIRIAWAFLLVFYLRVGWVSRDEFVRAERASRAGDVSSAVAHYRRAARHVAPPIDRVDESIDALFAIARRAEAESRVSLALSALRSVHGSIVASRFVWPRRTAARTRADRAIARLLGRIDRSPAFRGSSTASVVAMHERMLEHGSPESVIGLVLVLFGFGTFLDAGHRLTVRDLAIDDSIDPLVAKRSLVRLVVGLVVFVVGLFVV